MLLWSWDREDLGFSWGHGEETREGASLQEGSLGKTGPAWKQQVPVYEAEFGGSMSRGNQKGHHDFALDSHFGKESRECGKCTQFSQKHDFINMCGIINLLIWY